MSSTKLDNKSLADIGRLADYIKKLAATDPAKTIILAGFTDSAGNFAVNAALSQARAQEVREAIMRAAGPEIPASKIVARGYSELLPATCNTSLQGRNRNRRVEVWLK
jgi:phosphate transport system substrate-binding protein